MTAPARMCAHGWPGDTCGQAHPYIAEPTPLTAALDLDELFRQLRAEIARRPERASWLETELRAALARADRAEAGR